MRRRRAIASNYWHYTVGDRLCAIVADGYLKPATAFVPPNERPILWFTKEPFWEPTANKLLVKGDGTARSLTMKETREGCNGLYRIGVNTNFLPYDWRQLKRRSGMSPEIAKGLEVAARETGSRPRNWRGTFDCIPSDHWETVETLIGDKWVRVENS